MGKQSKETELRGFDSSQGMRPVIARYLFFYLLSKGFQFSYGIQETELHGFATIPVMEPSLPLSFLYTLANGIFILHMGSKRRSLRGFDSKWGETVHWEL